MGIVFMEATSMPSTGDEDQLPALTVELDRIAWHTGKKHRGRGRRAGQRVANIGEICDAVGLKRGALDALYAGKTTVRPETVIALAEWAAREGVPGYTYPAPWRLLFRKLGWWPEEDDLTPPRSDDPEDEAMWLVFGMQPRTVKQTMVQVAEVIARGLADDGDARAKEN